MEEKTDSDITIDVNEASAFDADILPAWPCPRELAQQKANESAISIAEMVERTRRAMRRNLPCASLLQRLTSPVREVVICGGGPSLRDELHHLRELYARDIPIYTVNKTHDYLVSRGIVPYAHVLLDPNSWVADYTSPIKGVRYLLAGQCCDAVFERFVGYPAYLWHAAVNAGGKCREPIATLNREFQGRSYLAVPGPTTVGLRTVFLAHAIHQATHFHMFGFDSSRKSGSLHAYAKPERQDVPSVSVVLKSRDGSLEQTFDTNIHMMVQAMDFERLLTEEMPRQVLAGKMPFFRFKFYGTGLLPTMAALYGLHASREMNERWKVRAE